MKTTFQIIKSEFNALFHSPIAWLVLVIYTFQLSFAFTEMLNQKLTDAALGQSLNNLTFQLFISGFGSPLYKTVLSSLFLYIPLLTMGVMSKEYSSGSIKLLLSSPITNSQIILGKYFSILAYGLIMMLIILVYIIFGSIVIKDIDLPLLLSGLGGIYLLFCFYAAIGLFFSCITSYQIVAALCSLVAMIAFQLVGGIFQTVDYLGDITFWLMIGTHSMVGGLISSDDVLYYLLFSGMFVVFAILNLKFQRQNISFVKKGVQYLAVFIVTITLGYITSRPQAIFYWDATRFAQRTLTPKSQELLSEVKEKPVLTSYVNFMAESHVSVKGLPENKKTDMLAFGSYVRFKPNMEMNYVYYYGHGSHGHHQGSQPHDHGEFMDLAKKTAKVNAINFDKALTDDEVTQIIDPKEEEAGLVRTLQIDSLSKAYIRMYNDLQVYPGEDEISTAIATMLYGSAKIGFLSGHGERSLDRNSDLDYSGITNELNYRISLINRGFSPLSLTLDKDIPTDIDILVIADMKMPLSTEELERLNSYIERGGNLVVNIDINRNTQMASILDLLGLEASSGILAQKNQGYSPSLIFSYLTENSFDLGQHIRNLKERRFPLIMSGSVSLKKKADKGYSVKPLLEARSGTWIANTENPDEIVDHSIAAANATDILNTAMILKKNRGEKEQRILVFADADWFSKGELNAGRSFAVVNDAMITNMFKWMSYDKYPISFDRPSLPDNELFLKFEQKKSSNFFFLFAFPFFWLACGSIVWYIRRRK